MWERSLIYIGGWMVWLMVGRFDVGFLSRSFTVSVWVAVFPYWVFVFEVSET